MVNGVVDQSVCEVVAVSRGIPEVGLVVGKSTEPMDCVMEGGR